MLQSPKYAHRELQVAQIVFAYFAQPIYSPIYRTQMYVQIWTLWGKSSHLWFKILPWINLHIVQVQLTAKKGYALQYFAGYLFFSLGVLMQLSLRSTDGAK